jgi:hypothetical protein
MFKTKNRIYTMRNLTDIEINVVTGAMPPPSSLIWHDTTAPENIIWMHRGGEQNPGIPTPTPKV